MSEAQSDQQKILELLQGIANQTLAHTQELVVIRESLRTGDDGPDLGLRVVRIEQALAGLNETVQSIYDHTIGPAVARKSIHDLVEEERRAADGRPPK